jgi:hypothetical protein
MSFTTLPPITISPLPISSRPRDHAQQRRLAAPRGPDQHRELAVGDVDVHAADHVRAAEMFVDVADVDGCHYFPSTTT